MGVMAAVLPFGPFVYDNRMKRQMLAEGKI
jgi:hypothetical protein